jgi:hypothetical protein
VLVVCDDDTDPYNTAREWWNSDGQHYRTPREDLFAQLGLGETNHPVAADVGKGGVIWMHENPASLATNAEGDARLVATVKQAAVRAKLKWRETNYLLLRRGPYVLGAGLDESVGGEAKTLRGRFVNLFDPELRVQKTVSLVPGARLFLLDLDATRGGPPRVLASACKALPARQDARSLSITVEGVIHTPAVVLLRAPAAPRSVKLAGQTLENLSYDPDGKLLWLRFTNEAQARELVLEF